MPIFNNILRSDNNSLIRKPTTAFANIVASPYQYAVLPYAQVNNLVGWFNNGDGITLATGVSAWIDRVSGATLAQGTGALQPTYTQQVQAINGKNKIAFASTQYMSAGDVFDVRTNTGFTVSWYMKLLTTNTGRTVFGKTPVTSTASAVAGEWRLAYSGGGGLIIEFFDNVSLKQTSVYAFDTNNYYLYSVVIDIANSLLSLYINEKVVKTVAISNAAVDYNTGQPFVIQTNSSLSTAEYLEGLVYQVALTQSEIAQNAQSMKIKFGQL